MEKDQYIEKQGKILIFQFQPCAPGRAGLLSPPATQTNKNPFCLQKFNMDFCSLQPKQT